MPGPMIKQIPEVTDGSNKLAFDQPHRWYDQPVWTGTIPRDPSGDDEDWPEMDEPDESDDVETA